MGSVESFQRALVARRAKLAAEDFLTWEGLEGTLLGAVSCRLSGPKLAVNNTKEDRNE
jgi:hypothetical protein